MDVIAVKRAKGSVTVEILKTRNGVYYVEWSAPNNAEVIGYIAEHHASDSWMGAVFHEDSEDYESIVEDTWADAVEVAFKIAFAEGIYE